MPKGTGLVEAALRRRHRDPRLLLRAAARAARRRVPHVPRARSQPGPPKPQAACTLTAADGMVVHDALTRRSSQPRRQNATLEFILVNHPLDCPVCDKGGECPLQDLTFRYGPGSTRMTFSKRTFDKPIPISPMIALDRERCILCYRCTRFSEAVAEDGQLIAPQPRRAVRDRDVRGRPVPRALLRERHRALPGGRAHLDPVPLRSPPVGDPERAHRLRPLPGRLQHHGHHPRGQGQAHPLAQPPRGGRGLALRQGSLRAIRRCAPQTA